MWTGANSSPSQQAPCSPSFPPRNLGPALSSLRDTTADIHARTLHRGKWKTRNMCTACVTLQEKAEVLFCQYFRKSWQGGNKNLSHFILHTLQWTVSFQLRDHSWLQHLDKNFRKRSQNHLDPPTTSIYLASFPSLVPRPSLSFPSLAVSTVLQATGSWKGAWERGYSFPGSLFESLGTRLLST